MNLCIDIGNTTVKAAVFSERELAGTFRFGYPGTDEMEKIKSSYPHLNRVIACSVRPADELCEWIRNAGFVKYIFLGRETPLPVENMYTTGETLGYDRIAAVVGANNIFPSSNVLVVDAGTAITFDIVTSDRKYIGGNISPGIEMRFMALNHFTARLPLVEMSEVSAEGVQKLASVTTKEAIIQGVSNSALFEAEGYINRMKKIYKPLKIIFTGGNANFFDKRLKYPIFVNSNLVFIGLNRILEYNEEF